MRTIRTVVILALALAASGCAVVMKPDLETTAYIAGKASAYAIGKDRELTADQIAKTDAMLEEFEVVLSAEGPELVVAVEVLMLRTIPALVDEKDRIFAQSIVEDLAGSLQERELTEQERKARAIALRIVAGMRAGLALLL